MKRSSKTDDVVEVSREVLLRDARSVKVGSDDIGCSHSNDVSKHGGENGVVETIQNEEVDQCDHGIAGNARKADRADRTVLWLSASEEKGSRGPERRCRQYAHGEHVDRNHNDHVSPQIRRIAEKGVVDYRDVGSANENANACVVQRLEDILHLLAHTEEVVEDGTATETTNCAQYEHGNWPARNARIAIHVVVDFLMNDGSKRNVDMV